MKLKVMTSLVIWLIVITGAHLWLNVGFSRFSRDVQVALGNERPNLVVGFLPVT